LPFFQQNPQAAHQTQFAQPQAQPTSSETDFQPTDAQQMVYLRKKQSERVIKKQIERQRRKDLQALVVMKEHYQFELVQVTSVSKELEQTFQPLRLPSPKAPP
jgi:hypothetical protein